MTTYSNETSRFIYARVAGFTFLFYIAAGITSMNLDDQSQMIDVLSLLMSFSALVLGVTLYVLTRDQGPALAMMALVCRVLEAVPVPLAWRGVIASALYATLFNKLSYIL